MKEVAQLEEPIFKCIEYVTVDVLVQGNRLGYIVMCSAADSLLVTPSVDVLNCACSRLALALQIR